MSQEVFRISATKERVGFSSNVSLRVGFLIPNVCQTGYPADISETVVVKSPDWLLSSISGVDCGR